MKSTSLITEVKQQWAIVIHGCMGDHLSALFVSDGFASHPSRLKQPFGLVLLNVYLLFDPA